MPNQFSFKTPPRGPLLALALGGAFVAGGLTLPVLAASAQDAAMQHGMGMGVGMGDHARMHAMMAAHVDRMLTSVDATPDQKARINAILGGAMRSMGETHGQMHERMLQLHAILAAPAVDRGALERLRGEQMASLDTASRTITSAIADAADVLTPAQRAKLAAEMQSMHRPG